jgi:hypothetical protein
MDSVWSCMNFDRTRAFTGETTDAIALAASAPTRHRPALRPGFERARRDLRRALAPDADVAARGNAMAAALSRSSAPYRHEPTTTVATPVVSGKVPPRPPPTSGWITPVARGRGPRAHRVGPVRPVDAIERGRGARRAARCGRWRDGRGGDHGERADLAATQRALVATPPRPAPRSTTTLGRLPAAPWRQAVATCHGVRPVMADLCEISSTSPADSAGRRAVSVPPAFDIKLGDGWSTAHASGTSWR